MKASGKGCISPCWVAKEGPLAKILNMQMKVVELLIQVRKKKETNM